MTHFRRKTVLLAWFAAVVLTGCAPQETIPAVSIASDRAGVEISPPESHGPETLLGSIGAAPDVPSGTSVQIGRAAPLHNKTPRYFLPASGTLDVVSLERPADYNTSFHSFEENVRLWKRVLDGPRMPDEQVRRLLYNDHLTRDSLGQRRPLLPRQTPLPRLSVGQGDSVPDHLRARKNRRSGQQRRARPGRAGDHV